MLKIDVITLFPGIFLSPLSESIIKRAVDKKLIEIRIVNLRDYALDKHKVTDDYPFGGGGGMVLKPEPVFGAVEDMKGNDSEARVILLSPQGKLFSQEVAEELSKQKHIILICGRYEGVDERVREYLVDDEISIGDYILTGGEIPALVIMDAVTRLIPAVLGNESSRINESFSSGILDYPDYTRPAIFRDKKVPEVLVSGDHNKINIWRRQQALRKTYEKRKDLLEKASLSIEDEEYIEKIKNN